MCIRDFHQINPPHANQNTSYNYECVLMYNKPMKLNLTGKTESYLMYLNGVSVKVAEGI